MAVRLSFADEMAAELRRGPARFWVDVAMMPRTLEVSQAIAQARWMVANEGQQQAAPVTQPPPAAVHGTVANGRGAQHTMVSNGAPMGHTLAAAHNRTHTLGAQREALGVQGRMPRPLTGSVTAAEAAGEHKPATVPQAVAKRAAQRAKARSQGQAIALSVRTHEYRRAVAEVIRQAAECGLVGPVLRIGRHGRAADLREVGEALLLADRLARGDQRDRWWMCDRLMPELGVCIAELRLMESVELRLARHEAKLAALQLRTRAGSVAPIT